MTILKDKKELQTPINEKITAPSMQLITHEGANLGVVSRSQALQLAHEAGLDLVVIAPQGADGFPIAKIMDFGKQLYEKKKKKAESKKHQKVVQVKEVKIRPKIGMHDYLTKMKQAIQFLQDGKRVKITLCFRGRENATKDERGGEMFQQVNKTFEEHNLLDSLVQEKDMHAGKFLSRVYYLKGN